MGIYNERINVLQMRTSPQVQSKIPVEKRPFKVSKIFLNKLASLEDATRTKDRTTHLLEDGACMHRRFYWYHKLQVKTENFLFSQLLQKMTKDLKFVTETGTPHILSVCNS